MIIKTDEFLLIKELVCRESPPFEEQSDRHLFLVTIIEELKQTYDNPDLKIYTIAKNLAVSERQFYRIFKELLDVTPAKFLRDYRLEKAFTMINKGIALGNIAFDVGFSSHSYFSRCFRDKYGYAPSEVMKKLPYCSWAGYC